MGSIYAAPTMLYWLEQIRCDGDNPSLTCRLHGMQDLSPIRIILGNNIPDTSTVLTDAGKTHILSGDIPYILQKITDLGGTTVAH